MPRALVRLLPISPEQFVHPGAAVHPLAATGARVHSALPLHRSPSLRLVRSPWIKDNPAMDLGIFGILRGLRAVPTCVSRPVRR